MMLQAQGDSWTGPTANAAAVATLRENFQTLAWWRWYISDGWSDGTWMLNDWRHGQLKTNSAGLTITFAKNPAAVRGYSSGELQSRATYGYGYYEAKMSAGKGGGLDTGFFTYIGPPNGRPWNEIDVEILGKNTRQVQLTYHNGNQQVATLVSLPFDAGTELHRFGFDWQPTYVRWYIDGRLVHEELGAKLALPSEPQKVFFNLWGSASMQGWLGSFNPSTVPYAAQVTCFAMSARFSGTLC